MNETIKSLRAGAVIRTPFEPTGRMRVERWDGEHVWGIFVGDHHGYADGSPALYMIRDWHMRPVTEAA